MIRAFILVTAIFGISLFVESASAQPMCEHNDDPVAKISPCFGSYPATITVTPGRRLSSLSGSLVFKRVVANGVPSQVIAPISAAGTVVVPQALCMTGGGRWEVWLTLAGGQSQGKIGAYSIYACPGGSTGLGKGPSDPVTPKADETIILPPIVMNVDNEVYAKTRSTSQSYIKNISSTMPAVATGTEWGTNEVKIYGKKPGTTTITFRDDNTGTNYRVQVTVNEKPKPFGGGGAGPVKVNPPAANGKFDPCLVGAWTSVQVTSSFNNWTNGGENVLLNIGGDGQASIDYGRMQPSASGNRTWTWGGAATGQLMANSNSMTVTGKTYEVTSRYTGPGQDGVFRPMSKNGLGNLFQEINGANTKPVYRYTCDATTMTIEGFPFSSTWKRVGTTR